MVDTIVNIGLAVALILAIADEVQARGQSLIAWSAIVAFAVLLYARLA